MHWRQKPAHPQALTRRPGTTLKSRESKAMQTTWLDSTLYMGLDRQPLEHQSQSLPYQLYPLLQNGYSPVVIMINMNILYSY